MCYLQYFLEITKMIKMLIGCLKANLGRSYKIQVDSFLGENWIAFLFLKYVGAECLSFLFFFPPVAHQQRAVHLLQGLSVRGFR